MTGKEYFEINKYNHSKIIFDGEVYTESDLATMDSEEYEEVMDFGVMEENEIEYEREIHQYPYCCSCGSENVCINSAGGTWCSDCRSYGTVSCPDEEFQEFDEDGNCMCSICTECREHDRNQEDEE